MKIDRDRLLGQFGAVVALGVVGALFVADRATFEDSPPSPLYSATLERARNRFRDDDVNVSIGRRPRSHEDTEVTESTEQNANAPAHSHDSPNMTKAAELVRQQKHAEALQLYMQEYANAHTCSFLKHRVADCYRNLGRWEEAVRAYQDLRQTDPNYLCAAAHLSDIYRRRGEPAMAAKFEEMFETACRGLIAKGGSAADRGRSELAVHLIETGQRPDEAIVLATELVSVTPSTARREMLARALELAGRKDDAVKVLDQLAADDGTRGRYSEWRKRLAGGSAGDSMLNESKVGDASVGDRTPATKARD